jgi:hypothetical protein
MNEGNEKNERQNEPNTALKPKTNVPPVLQNRESVIPNMYVV